MNQEVVVVIGAGGIGMAFAPADELWPSHSSARIDGGVIAAMRAGLLPSPA